MKKNLTLGDLTLNWFVAFALLAFPIFFMSVRHAVHVPLFLLALLAAYKIVGRKSPGSYCPGVQELLVLAAFSAIFISTLVSQIFRQALYFPAFDGPLRIMIAGIVFIFLRTLNIPYIKVLGIGIPLGLIATFISFELYPQASQTYWGGRYATYFVDPNTLGSQSFILCLLCLLMILPIRIESVYVFSLKLLGFGVGLYLSIGSGSRGGWLTAPFIFFLFFIFRRGDISRASEAIRAKMYFQTLIIFAGILSLVVFGIYYSDKLSTRIISAFFEVRNWFTGLDLEGSAGVRLSIWKFSLEFAKQSFLFGYGEEKNMIQVLQGSGLNIPENMTAINAMALTGPHSDILSKLLSAGIFGLAAYLSVLIIPCIIFWQHRYSLNTNIKMASRIGLYYICGVFIAGLSNEQLSLKYLCTFYGLMVATLLAQVLYKPLAIEAYSPIFDCLSGLILMGIDLITDNAKVVLFSDSSINIGGQELQALQQMRSLNALGYETILLCKPNSAIANRAKNDGLVVQEIRFRNAFHIPSLMKLFILVKEKSPVAMFCHGSHDALICALVGMVQVLLGRKRIPVFRVKTFQHGYPLSFAYNYLFSGTIIPSNYLRSRFLDNPAIKSHKLQIVYPGIDFSALDGSTDPLPEHVLNWLEAHPGPVVSHGAILRGEKGHSTILKALVEVKRHIPNVRYLIAGEGQDKPLLEAEIAALELSENVLLTGILKKIAPLLRKSDLAVLPSLVEPLGMFQIEAQYLEVPTIASRVGGIPETMLDQETGLMIEHGNVEQWAQAIIWMLSNPEPAKQMAKAGKRMVVDKFSLDANTQSLISLFEKA